MINDMIIMSQFLVFLNNIPQVLLTSFGLVLILLFAELIFVDFKESSLFNLMNLKGSSSIDFFSAILVLTNASLYLGVLLSFGLFYGLSKVVRTYCDFEILDYDKNPYLSYFIYLLVLDFFNYWAHRFMHEYPLLWSIHRFHHSATKMTMLTALRDHPLERAVLQFFKAIPAAILGVPIVDYVVFALIMEIIGYLKHSNINTNFGFVGHYLIQSPLAHRIHHSNNPEEHGLNYASLFQFWDVLFGTARNSSNGKIIDIGLGDGEGSKSIYQELISVTVSFYKMLFYIKDK